MSIIILPYPLHLTPFDIVLAVIGVVVFFLVFSVLGWLAYRLYERHADSDRRNREFHKEHGWFNGNTGKYEK